MFRSENPEEDFRNVLEKRLSVDDLVYHGSLVAFHKNQLDRRADDMPLNDTALYHLTLGARAPIISGHMLNTLRIQSISDHNVSSGQKSDTFKMCPVMRI